MVGSSWRSTIALYQCIIDQELVEECILIYIENNRGEFIAHNLFTQFQEKKQFTIIGPDSLLSGFKGIRKTFGDLHTFSMNPLASIDVVAVFDSLVYRKSSDKRLKSTKQIIHFAGSCGVGVV